MQDDSTTNRDTTKEKSRRETILTLAGVAMGGIISLAGNIISNQAVSNESAVNFVRTQRAAAYGDYLADSVQMENAIDDCGNTFASGKDITWDSALQNKFRNLQDIHQTFITARYRVQLVMSPSQRAAEETNYGTLNAAYGAVVEAAEKTAARTFTEQDSKIVRAAIDQDFHDHTKNNRKGFVEAVRPDLVSS